MDVTQGPAGGGSRWIESMAGSHKQVSLAFIDPSLGGTGYLRRIAD
ncbi:MAG: hypothetical protein AAB403_07215 [Planctomycetota bacterium]